MNFAKLCVEEPGLDSYHFGYRVCVARAVFQEFAYG